MSLEILRNVKDGSMREVETNSDEYIELINELYDHEGSARPKWEITGRHHMLRLDGDNVQEADHGYEHKPIPPVVANFDEIGPEAHPERALTPGEVDSGITSHEEKMESVNAAVSSLGAVGHTADRPVEPLEKSPPEQRAEEGPANAGRQSSGRRRSSRRTAAEKQPAGAGASSGGSGSASSGSSGSGSSGSGSSGSGGSGSSGS